MYNETVSWLRFPESNIYFRPDIEIGLSATKEELAYIPSTDNPEASSISLNVDWRKGVIVDKLPIDNSNIVSARFSIVKSDYLKRLIVPDHPESTQGYLSRFDDTGQIVSGLRRKENKVADGTDIVDELYVDSSRDPTIIIHCPSSGNDFVPLCIMQSNRIINGYTVNASNSEIALEVMMKRDLIDDWAEVHDGIVQIAKKYVRVRHLQGVSHAG